MKASATLLKVKDHWVIENANTGDWLAKHDAAATDGYEFGARMPLYYASVRSARETWLRHCVAQGYLERRITLPKEPVQFGPGPNFAMMPRVQFMMLEQRPAKLAVYTLEELGIAKT